MKYDPYKAFPYPILDAANNDDYTRRDFQPRVSLEPHNENDKQVLLTAHFVISEEAILECIAQGQAEYAVHVLCTQTNFRYLCHSKNNNFTHLFKEGELHSKVTVMPCVICTDTIRQYHSDNFHAEFNKATYDMESGSVLAIAEPENFYIDADPTQPIGSVFQLKKSDKIHKGEFEFDCDGDYIIIFLNGEDYTPFNVARASQHVRNFLIMSVYYPVLIEILRLMSADDDSLEEKKWYRAIKSKLDAKNLDISIKENCYLYAQRLMNSPLKKLLVVEDKTND